MGLLLWLVFLLFFLIIIAKFLFHFYLFIVIMIILFSHSFFPRMLPTTKFGKQEGGWSGDCCNGCL